LTFKPAKMSALANQCRRSRIVTSAALDRLVEVVRAMPAHERDALVATWEAYVPATESQERGARILTPIYNAISELGAAVTASTWRTVGRVRARYERINRPRVTGRSVTGPRRWVHTAVVARDGPPDPYRQKPFTLSQLAGPPPKRRRTGPLVAVVIVTVLVLLAGGTLTYLVLRPGTLTITGSLRINDSFRPDDDCVGIDGFSDIRGGAQVTVTDARGTVVAIGALGAGVMAGNGTFCTFRFTVKNVPSGKGFYGIEVSHRGSTEPQTRTAGDGLASVGTC
jgi:hypothetical protein